MNLDKQGSLKLWWRLGRQNTVSERVVCELHVTAQYRRQSDSILFSIALLGFVF